MSHTTMRASPPLSSSSLHNNHHSTTSADDTPPDASINHKDAITYWSSVSPTVNGMLGGFPQISRIDLQGSRNFVGKLLKRRRSTEENGIQQEGGEEGDRGAEEEGRTRSKRARLDHGVEDGTNGDAGEAQGQAAKPQSQEHHSTQPPFARAVDCGAGIGRITDGLLLSLASIVDIVEPVTQFTDQIRKASISVSNPPVSTTTPTEASTPHPSTATASPISTSHIGTIYNLGLEDWEPEKGTYDLIWNQWCLGQLTDAQLTLYLRRCVAALTSDGYVIVKENLSTHGEGKDVFDDEDSSVTRSQGKWEALFAEAGLRVVMSEVQRGFPKELGLYPVKCWALRAGEEE